MKNKQKVVVLSEDGLSSNDMQLLKTLPNFKKYIAGGAEVEQFFSVHPSVTYICHTSMITGCYPDKHGIFGNEQFAPAQKPVWNWYADKIKCTDIFDLAKQQGLTTAAVFWPVTGNHKSIDYLINEIWSESPDITTSQMFLNSGTSKLLFDTVVSKHIDALSDRNHPVCDTFLINCAADIIRNFSPDLTMIHPAQIDAYKHNHGESGQEVKKGIHEADEHIGIIGKALSDAGILENTDFILTSDHGQRDFSSMINVNTALYDEGLIKVSPDGKLLSYDAFCATQGITGYVYLKQNADKKLKDKVSKILINLVEKGLLKRFVSEDELSKLHLSGGGFTFMVEANEFTAISDRINESRIIFPAFSPSHISSGQRGAHGYRQGDGPNPVFYAKGKSFKNGATQKTASIIDLAPTIAKILNLKISADGKETSDIIL